MIAALFVAIDGVYFGLRGVDPWDKARDARVYSGNDPVVAHPPCERWGRYWGGAGPVPKSKEHSAPTRGVSPLRSLRCVDVAEFSSIRKQATRLRITGSVNRRGAKDGSKQAMV